MEQHLKRILRLVQKTGDTMVVVDKDGEDAFVVMDLGRYEQLLDSPAVLQPQTQSKDEPTPPNIETPAKRDDAPLDIWDVMKGAHEEGETWDLDQLNDTELEDLEKQFEEFAKRNVQEAIEETTEIQPSGEVQAPVPSGVEDVEEYGEEQFYLEPIE